MDRNGKTRPRAASGQKRATPEATTHPVPHDLEAEAGVLASVLMEPERLDEVLEIMGTEDFFSDRHQRLFDAMRRLEHAGIPIDPINLRDDLRQHGQDEDPTYLVAMYDAMPSAKHAAHYARIVHRHAMARRIARRLEDYAERAWNGTGPDQLLGELDFELTDLLGETGGQRMGVRASSQDLREVIDDAAAGLLAGWSTGFRKYDEACGGIYPGDLIIVAGATSIGKSILALNLAEHFAFSNRRAAYFSIEMALRQLLMRTLSSRSDIAMAEVRKHGLSDEWAARLEDTAKTLGPVIDENLELWDVRHFTPGRFRIMTKAAKARGGLQLAVVDFIQLMGVDQPEDTKEREMATIAQSLKAVARELGIAVVGVSQLNLQWTQQQRRPTKEDLKYSSAIEQAADTVLILHNEKPGRRDFGGEKLMLFVDKQRNDVTPYFELEHRAGRFRFEEA